jgi:hypothetical protein
MQIASKKIALTIGTEISFDFTCSDSSHGRDKSAKRQAPRMYGGIKYAALELEPN